MRSQDGAAAAPAHGGGERVSDILDAVNRVVARDGAHGLRMASVAREAGVSKALVHYYFATRQDLLRAAFAHSTGRWEEAVESDLAAASTGAERAERYLAAALGLGRPYEDHRALWNEVWSSLRSDDELRPLVQQAYRGWLDRLVELIEEGRADGSVPTTVEAEPAGWRLAALADGIDSILYLGLLDGEAARELLSSCVRRELAR